ncbi:MAG: hypothetical protein ABFS43_06260 [Thermodesulfobacteriota bacterium]
MAENTYKMPPLKRLGEYIQSAPEKIEQVLQHQRILLRQGEKPLLGELLVSEGLISRSVLEEAGGRRAEDRDLKNESRKHEIQKARNVQKCFRVFILS